MKKEKISLDINPGINKKALDQLGGVGGGGGFPNKPPPNMMESFSTIKKGDDLANPSQYIDDDDQDFYDPKIYMHDIYYSMNPAILGNTVQDSYISVNELLKQIITDVVAISKENQIIQKTPAFSFNHTMFLTQLNVQGYFMPEIATNGQESQVGLVDDEEPVPITCQAWIRSYINVDIKMVEPATNPLCKIKTDFCHFNLQLFKQKLVENLKDSQVRRNSFLPSSRQGLREKSEIINSSSANIIVNKSQVQESMPAPINLVEDLDLSQTQCTQQINEGIFILKYFFSFSIEDLRFEKRQKERKKQLEEQNIEQQKQNWAKQDEGFAEKVQKDQQNVGLTSDFDGKPLPITRVKVQKLPPSAYSVNFAYQDEVKIEESGKQQKGKQVDGVLNSGQKQTPDTEKDFVQSVTALAINFDTIALTQGVSITFDGRTRKNPQISSDLFTTSVSGQLQMSKKQYNDFVENQGYNRTAGPSSAGSGNIVDQINKKKLDEINEDFQQHNIQKIMAKTTSADAFSKLNVNKIQSRDLDPNIQTEALVNGQIQIKSSKYLQSLTHVIAEEDEILMRMIRDKQELQRYQKMEQLQNSNISPIDQFNMEVTMGSSWGQGSTYVGHSLHEKFQNHHPSDRLKQSTMGTVGKPRERFFQSLENSQQLTPVKPISFPQLTDQLIQLK